MEKDDGLKILYFTVVDDLTFIKVESLLNLGEFTVKVIASSLASSHTLHIITNEPTKSRGVFFAP